MTESTDNRQPELLDRDLSWLEFNQRVLHEAADEPTPLLERLKFVAIVGANLDEFFMKRLAALKRRARARADSVALGPGADAVALGPGAYQHQQAVRQKVLDMTAELARIYCQTIRPALAREGIHLLDWEHLSDDERRQANELFRQKIYPVLTPLVVDPSHPFPFLSNLSQSLGLLLKNADSGETLFGRVKAPGHVPAWLRLEPTSADGRGLRFCRTLDVIRANLADLFPEMSVTEVMPFRVTRNAEVEEDDVEGESLIDHVAEELRQRRLERAGRLEYEPPASATQVALLVDRLGLEDGDAYEAPGNLDFSALMPLAGLPRPELRDPPWEPIVPSAFADAEGSIFSIIRGGDVLVHHPYESFDATTARFIRAA